MPNSEVFPSAMYVGCWQVRGLDRPQWRNVKIKFNDNLPVDWNVWIEKGHSEVSLAYFLHLNILSFVCVNPWRRIVEWIYRPTFSWPPYNLEIASRPGCFYPCGKRPGAHWIGGRVGLPGLDSTPVTLSLSLLSAQRTVCWNWYGWSSVVSLYSWHW
jgi:hypothetical protein